MTTIISEYFAEGSRGKAVVGADNKGMLVINYYDDQGHHFFFEEYPEKSLRYVEDAAENWALGIKKLEDAV